jgi:hypothetical protein
MLFCVGEFLGLNTKEEDKTCVRILKTVVGIMSGALKVDEVEFLLHRVAAVREERSYETLAIKAAFEKLLRERKLLYGNGQNQPSSEEEEGEEECAGKKKKTKRKKRGPYRTLRSQGLLVCDVCDIYFNDSSAPILSKKTGLKPFWKYILDTLDKENEHMKQPSYRTSLNRCIAWAAKESKLREARRVKRCIASSGCGASPPTKKSANGGGRAAPSSGGPPPPANTSAVVPT